MELINPSSQYKDSFLAALKEHQVEGRYMEWDYEKLDNDFDSFVQIFKDEAQGKNLKPGYVPETTFWLIDNNEFIGRISIRHNLNDSLRKEGGHIGYDIRPSKRKMGYGKKILELAL